MYLSDPRVDDLITVHNNKSPYVFRVTQKEVPSVSSMPNLGVFKWLFDMLYTYKHCKIAGYLWRKGVKFVPLTFLLQAVKTWETRGVKKCYYDFLLDGSWMSKNPTTATTNFGTTLFQRHDVSLFHSWYFGIFPTCGGRFYNYLLIFISCLRPKNLPTHVCQHRCVPYMA